MRANGYAPKAEAMLDTVADRPTQFVTGGAVGVAQAYATLALADEVRTANLIACNSSQLSALGQLSQAVKDLVADLDPHNTAQVARTQETLEKISAAAVEAQAVTEKLNVEIRARLGLA